MTNETKSGFFEKQTNNKTDKWTGRLTEKERAQINKIKNEADIKTDTIEVQKIRRDYYKQFNANKTGSLEEMNKFTDIYNPLRMNHKK